MKAMLFDLDGTLVDTLPLYIKSYSKALIDQGFYFSDKEIVERCFGKTEDDICTKLEIPEQTDIFRKTYFQGVQNHFVEGNLFPGVLDYLVYAKDMGMKLGVISFAYRWYVDRILEKLDIQKYFDIVIGFDDVKNPKPNPEAINIACEKLEIMPDEVLMIGDSKSDVMMGNAGGTKTALFHPDGHGIFYDINTLKESNPTFTISNFSELIKLI